MKTQPNIGIIGGSVWGNRGAEAMLVTTIGKIRDRFPEATFQVFTIHPQKDRTLVHDERIHFFDSRPLALGVDFLLAFLYLVLSKIKIKLPLPAALKALQKTDYLLDIGGITFADGRAAFLAYNVLSIWPAMLLGVRVIKLSQAMGPFKSALNRSLAKTFLPHCLHVFARGKFTAEHLENLPLDKALWSDAADIAFLYDPRYSLSSENEDKIQKLIARIQDLKSQSSKIISISPSVLVQEKLKQENADYARLFLDLITKTDSPDRHYIFFPNACREGSPKTRNNDLVTIQKIQGEAQASMAQDLLKRIDWVTYDINTHSVRRLVAVSDVLVTSRFHAMISGLVQCVPTMIIGWSHKYMEALEGFGLDDYVLDYKQTDVDFSQRLTHLLEKNQAIREKMKERQPAVCISAQAQFDYLENLLR